MASDRLRVWCTNCYPTIPSGLLFSFCSGYAVRMADPQNTTWKPGPGGAYSHPKALSVAESTQETLRLRAEWAARPEEIEKHRQHQMWTERQAIEKLARRMKDDGVYGPPNPRKGRVPMTR